MGKTRDFFKKMRDTKGTFHAKIGTIKDRNGKDPSLAVLDQTPHFIYVAPASQVAQW